VPAFTTPKSLFSGAPLALGAADAQAIRAAHGFSHGPVGDHLVESSAASLAAWLESPRPGEFGKSGEGSCELDLG
jgi:hypothetical protein